MVVPFAFLVVVLIEMTFFPERFSLSMALLAGLLVEARLALDIFQHGMRQTIVLKDAD